MRLGSDGEFVRSGMSPTPTPPCTGLGDPSIHNPGAQPDLLLNIKAGKYYGHPNPYRDECVFKDGSFQGVSALPNYESPMFVLGQNISGNGIIEYKGDAFFSKLMGQLLIAGFSTTDNITRNLLSDNGNAVVESDVLIGGFTEPLPITQDPEGNIYVGEFNGDKVTVLAPLPLNPEPSGSWTTKQPVPESVLDASGTSVDNKLYMVAGETSSNHISTLRIYDPVTDNWTIGPDLPGPAVEDPAVTEFSGKLYVFGGSTESLSGAITNAAVYDPELSAWTSLAPMPTARGGATAEELEGKIYVMGGIDVNGESLDTVEIYDPNTNIWTLGVPMQTRRDNPGSATINGKIYVFGGRTLNVNSTLSSIEIYDVNSNTWSFGAPMPTGRRSMVVGTISDRVQVIGGEDPAFSQNEEYDPTTDTWRIVTSIPTQRHGAVGATINGKIYVAGGGPTTGSSFTNVNEVFSFFA